MPGLNIVILTDDAERFRGALLLALTHLAMGGAARAFLQLDAARLLVRGADAPRDADHVAAGLPPLATILTEALDAGLDLWVCQSGLILANLTAEHLDPRIVTGGLVGFMGAAIGPLTVI